MNFRYFRFSIFLFVFLSFIGNSTLWADSAPVPRGTPGDLWADKVLGESDHGIANSAFGNIADQEGVTQSAFNLGGEVIDPNSGMLYVWDPGDNRILGLSTNDLSVTDTGQDQDYTASIVLGQLDFYHTGCNHDSNWQNFPTPPAASATCLCGTVWAEQSPLEERTIANMAVDKSGNLYVPDYWNNRIMRYNAPITSTEPASNFWGQPDFFSNAPNNMGGNTSGSPSAQNLYLSHTFLPTYASGVATDNWGNLWVADAMNNRVLRFPGNGTCCAPQSQTADVVLGQSSFSAKSPVPFLQPLAVRVDGAGNVYVVASNGNSYGNGSSVFVYKPTSYQTGTGNPIYNSGVTAVTPDTTIPLSSGNSPFGLEWDAPNNPPTSKGIGGAPGPGQSGGLWVSGIPEVDLVQITLGSSDQITSQIVKVLINDTPGSPVTSPATGDPPNLNFFNLSGGSFSGTPVKGSYTVMSVALDQLGNVFWPSGDGGLLRFPAPIPTPQAGILHSADRELLKPWGYGPPPGGSEWYPGYHNLTGFNTGIGIAEAKGVTQIVQSGNFLEFWNMPSNGPEGLENGQRVDGLIGANNPANPLLGALFNRAKADKVGHLWTLINSGSQIAAYNLPLVNGETAALTISSPLPVLGTSQTINWNVAHNADPTEPLIDLAVDPNGQFIWVSDTANNRVLRIRNPLSTPQVDIILGQNNDTDCGCNGNPQAAVGSYSGPGEVCAFNNAMVNPTQNSFAAPGAVVLDHHGDLFVSDHTLESAGNSRMLMFGVDSIQNTSNVYSYGIPASIVYGTGGSFTSNVCTNFDVCSPWEPCFNSDDSFMVVGSDAQASSNFFSLVLANPRQGDFPVTYLKDYGPQDFAGTFDDQNNLYIANHNRNRVLIYYQPFQNFVLTPTFTPTWTPTYTPTVTPTLTQANTPTFTNTNTPTITPTNTPTNTVCTGCSIQSVIGGNSGPASMNGPEGLAIDNKNGVLFVAGNGTNNFIAAYDLNGNFLGSSAPAPGEQFTDVTFSHEGRKTYVFASSSETSNVYEYTYPGFALVAGSPNITASGYGILGLWMQVRGGVGGQNALYLAAGDGVHRYDGSGNHLYGIWGNEALSFLCRAAFPVNPTRLRVSR